MIEKLKENFVSVILAAGIGTRMKSNTPKVLHKVLNKEILGWVIEAIKEVKPKKNILVIGHKADQVKSYCETKKYDLDYVFQREQLGSGDAVKTAISSIPKNFKGHVLVLCGDTPLLRKETILSFTAHHLISKNAVTILTAITENPFSYGRIKRDKKGNVLAIIEEKDATKDEKKIKEINSGVYCFKYSFLSKYIHKIMSNNIKKEYYLTDIIKLIREAKGKIGTYITKDFFEIFGINDRLALADVNKKMRDRINEKFMLSGVTIEFPETVFLLGHDIKIGKDTIIFANTIFQGNIEIGENCEIGPNVFIESTKIGNNTKIKYSYISEANIGSNVKIGPFSHIRPGTRLSDNCKVGNFSEIKKSVIGDDSKIPHLSYIGDSEIGKGVNIGAGTITCNYDGKNKYKTVIKDNTFIGSNTNLVAPIFIGEGAIVAAGSTICNDVPAHSLAIARARQQNKESWVKIRKEKETKK